MAYEFEGSATLLGLSPDELFKEAYSAVEQKNLTELGDIDILVKEHFCKTIAECKFDDLPQYNKLIVNFTSWFEWGGKSKWDLAVPIIEKWKTILEISQLVYNTESTQKAYRKLKDSPYGEMLVALLYEKKMMKPVDIKEELNIKTMSQLSDLLSGFEKAGIVVREVDGDSVWVSLGIQGMALYTEFIRSDAAYVTQLIIRALKDLENLNLENAKKTLLLARGKEPIAIFLLGIVALEKGQLEEAGKLFAESVGLGLEKGKMFLIFYILEEMKMLEKLREGIFMMHLQRDKISAKLKSTLNLFGLLYEYWGNSTRAKKFYKLAK